MMPHRKDQDVGEVVTGPWTVPAENDREPADEQAVAVAEEPTVAVADTTDDSAVSTREPVEAPARRIPGTGGEAEEVFGTAVAAARPLTIEQAGGRYRYVADVAKSGTRRLPATLLDGVVNKVKLAQYREGGHHRGAVLPQNRNAYAAAVDNRRALRREVTTAVFTKKVRKSSGGGRFRAAKVRESRSPRWLTVGPLAAEGAALAYPNALVTAPVHTINGHIGGFVASLGGNAAEALGAAVTSPGGVITAIAAALGVTGWQAMAEHRDRQDELETLLQREGNGDLVDGGPADYLTAAFRAAGIIKSPAGTAPGERVDLESPVSSDGASWTAAVVLPGGRTTAAVRKRITALASTLDRNLPQVAIINGRSERRLTMRVWTGDNLPFTGAPVPSPLAGAPRHDLRSGVPIGTDVDGNPVVLNLASGRHGLVVASSGNGKTVLLQVIGAAVVLDVRAKLTILDGKPDGSYTPLSEVCWGFATTAREGFEAEGADLLEAVAADMDDRLARAERGEDIGGEHVVIIDEFQEWTGSANGAGQKVGEPRFRMRAAMERIARRGRSAGVRLVLASQQYDGRTLDDGVLTNIGWRSVGYAPKKMSLEALGPLAERYDLDTSTMFVDEVQAGASVVAGGGIHPYRSQRSDLLTPDDLVAIAARARSLRENPQVTGADADLEEATTAESETPKLELGAEEQALLQAAAAVYADDDAEWITSSQLYTEVVVGELGWALDGATRTTVGTALRQAGVEKNIRQETVEGTRTSVTRYRRADLATAGQRLAPAA